MSHGPRTQHWGSEHPQTLPTSQIWNHQMQWEELRAESCRWPIQGCLERCQFQSTFLVPINLSLPSLKGQAVLSSCNPKRRDHLRVWGQHTKQSESKITWICTLILLRSSCKECQQPLNRTGIRKIRVQMLIWPVVLISCGLRKATYLCEWAMLGSPGSTVAAVVHPVHAEARTCISFLRSALEPLQPTVACWDP